MNARRGPRERQYWRRAWRPLLLLLGFLVLLRFLESALIFPTWQIPRAEPPGPHLEYEVVAFSATNGPTLHGWYLPHLTPRAVLLYCHANAETVGHAGPWLASVRDACQVSIFVFDYRGYGGSQGRPGEAGILADAEAAQRWLAARSQVEPPDIVVWGRSLGGAVAVHLATRLGARGLILERTFTSLPDVAAAHYPWLPVRTLMHNRFDALSKIGGYRGPLLQSHGDRDEIVPLRLGQQLFAAAPSAHKQFVLLANASHNSPNPPAYERAFRDFLATLPAASPERPRDLP